MAVLRVRFGVRAESFSATGVGMKKKECCGRGAVGHRPGGVVASRLASDDHAQPWILRPHRNLTVTPIYPGNRLEQQSVAMCPLPIHAVHLVTPA